MKATEQYFPVVLFIMLYKLALTFKSVDEILKCYHLNESFWAVLSCDTVSKALQTSSRMKDHWNTMHSYEKKKAEFFISILWFVNGLKCLDFMLLNYL